MVSAAASNLYAPAARLDVTLRNAFDFLTAALRLVLVGTPMLSPLCASASQTRSPEPGCAALIASGILSCHRPNITLHAIAPRGAAPRYSGRAPALRARWSGKYRRPAPSACRPSGRTAG